jgi:hypothetical protein
MYATPNVLLTAHHNMSVQQDQHDALFVFCLSLFNSLYLFKTLLAHLQEALHKQLVPW